jgi:hypothetical protein
MDSQDLGFGSAKRGAQPGSWDDGISRCTLMAWEVENPRLFTKPRDIVSLAFAFDGQERPRGVVGSYLSWVRLADLDSSSIVG